MTPTVSAQVLIKGCARHLDSLLTCAEFIYIQFVLILLNNAKAFKIFTQEHKMPLVFDIHLLLLDLNTGEECLGNQSRVFETQYLAQRLRL